MLFLCLILDGTDANAQKRVTVTGTVTSATGEPLSGVSVTVKDTKQGTVTDVNGVYSINVQTGKILTFEHVGYQPYAHGVTEAATVDVTMVAAVNSLEEVVVIGYGTQSRAKVTGSVSKLENKNLDEIPTSRLDNALIGKIAGVNIQNVTSEAGADPVIRVRGFNSINANAAPLVVVDGYPLPDGLAFVNPADVASIEVLKDAASAAIYGSRAANGVIIVTTKSGLPNRPKFNLKAYTGIRKPYKLNPIMNFTEYVEKLYREADLRQDDETVPANKKNLIQDTERAMYLIENGIYGEPTDWQQVGLQDANISNIQLGVSGGTKEMKYYISGNYQGEDGVMKFSNNQRISAKAKVDGNISKKLKFSVNFNPSYIKTQRPTVNYTDYFRFYSFLPVYHNDFSAAFVQQNEQWANIGAGDYAQARHFVGLPYSGRMPDGSMWSSSGPIDPWTTQNNNPFSIANRSKRFVNTYRVLGGIDLSYEILPKLIFKTAIGGYYNYQEDNTYTQTGATKEGELNSMESYGIHYQDLLWENTLNYTRNFNKHGLSILAGYTQQQTWNKYINIVGYDFPSENFKTISSARLIDQEKTKTLREREGLLSYLGRINYDYDSKYLLSVSFRTDGSSKFARGHQYGYFPSVSAGWVITREPFMKDVDDISNLKLRLSYGATGNNKIPPFAYLNLLNIANYPFGAGGTSLGVAPNGDYLGNPNITWERTFEFNAAVDAGFFNNRLTATLEYYNSISDHLLYPQAAMSFTGSSQFYSNAGKVRNRGFEVELGGSPVKAKDVEWTTSFNLSTNKNELLALGGESYQYNYGERNEIYAAIVGGPSIQYFGYKADGVWKSDAEIAAARDAGINSNLSKYFQTGGLKYADTDGNKTIDANDRVVLGTPFPDFIWGFNNTLRYKNFDLSFLFQGSQGGQLINGDLYYNETKRLNKNVNTENRWLSAKHPGDGNTPYFTNGADWMLSDYVMEDASYMSLRNLILGYKLPERINTKRLGISSLRIYGSADNLWYRMAKNYRGINPEARATGSQYGNNPLIGGYQRGAFPLMRTFIIGIDLNF